MNYIKLFLIPSGTLLKKPILQNADFVFDENASGYINDMKHPQRIVNTTYIGGKDNRETREKAIKYLGAHKIVEEIALLYGIDPNLLMERFTMEGVIDNYIRDYNDSYRFKNLNMYQGFNSQNMKSRYFDERFWNGTYDTYNDFGLDTFLERYMKGSINIKDDNIKSYIDDIVKNNKYILRENEVGHPSAQFNLNPKLALHLLAALLRSLQDRYQNDVLNGSYGNVNLNTWLNAAYNLGEHHKDLKDSKWINKKYTITPWYKTGNKINNYLNLFKNE